MKEIKAYKTSDGRVFDNESDACNHEGELNLRISVEQFVANHFFHGMLKGDLVEMIIDNVVELKEILKNATKR